MKMDRDIVEDDEERKDQRKDETFFVSCVDESEYVYVFSHKSAKDSRKGSGFQHKIKDCKEVPEEIRNKDLFGMGYPYYISLYEKYIAISTDYGVCLLEIADSSSVWDNYKIIDYYN